jgi:hypothetical protein
VEALSVAELEVAGPAADGSAEGDAGEAEEDAGVEGRGVQAGALGIVPVAEAGAGKGAPEPRGAAEDLEALADAEGHVEDIGVVLDKLDGADAQSQVCVGLLGGVGVRVSGSLSVMAVVTHIIS